MGLSAHLPSNAEAKNEWSYATVPLYVFMMCTRTALNFMHLCVSQSEKHNTRTPCSLHFYESTWHHVIENNNLVTI